jgi:hypothetical protein
MDRMMSTLNNITKLEKKKRKEKTLPDSTGHKFCFKNKKTMHCRYVPFHKVVAL